MCPVLCTNEYICTQKFKKTDMKIGKNLINLRNKNNATQQEVADFLEVDRKTYVGWEADRAQVKSSYIPKLAEFFQVEINDLFREDFNRIVINQQNTDNKDNSINGIVILLTDKESVSELVNVLKGRLK